MEKVYNQLAELLEVEEVKDSDALEDFECWDSLTILTIIALSSDHYSKNLSANDIKEAKTIGRLISILKK